MKSDAALRRVILVVAPVVSLFAAFVVAVLFSLNFFAAPANALSVVPLFEADAQPAVTPQLPAAPTAIVVNTTRGDLDADDVRCSLPEAVFNANQNNNFYPECGSGVGAITVTFAPRSLMWW